MPTPHTIELNYDFRIVGILKQLIKNQEKDISDFSNGDELFEFIWNNPDNLGQLLHDDMFQFMDEDEWLEIIKK